MTLSFESLTFLVVDLISVVSNGTLGKWIDVCVGASRALPLIEE